MSEQVKVSVIINTADRAKYLGDTLVGLSQQTYDNFEVIVVNGPSEDNTEEIAKSFNIRYYEAPYNLSISRNIGIKAAAGEIVAFIDDDAVPTPTWIEEIVEAYKDPTVGGAGGFVYHTGNAHYQFCYGAINMWGMPKVEMEPTKAFNYNEPYAEWYNINIGTNASYRRSYLVEIGGFDEEYEYYHDESDVCVRMIDAGYKIVELSGALVHHKMAPSSRRKSWKSVVNWDSMVKNGIYFALKYTKAKAPLAKRIFKPAWEERHKIKDTARALKHRQINIWQFFYKLFGLARATFRGYHRGFFQSPKLLTDYKFDAKKFKKYKKDIEDDSFVRRKIVLVSQGFPPHATDGIARYNHTLAKQLAKDGHHVSVITRSQDGRDQTVYREGVWIYYHNPDRYAQQVTGYDRLDNVLSFTKSVYRTAETIKKAEGIDLILAPLWDVEGLALIRDKIAPVILTLMSPLKKVVETQWSTVNDPSLEYMYELERYVIEHADGVMAISQAIADTIGSLYGITWSDLKRPLEVIPLGVDDSLISSSKGNRSNDDEVELLFVGRFERRKGIDLLLSTLPNLLVKNPQLKVRLIGNSDVNDIDGKNFWTEFQGSYKHEPWFSRIQKDGYVTDASLAEAYRDCDIFVAPSRYESFGLIFIEAMANAKPVIGTNVGGIPETIIDSETGYLFENENINDLSAKIQALVDSKQKREKMGKQALDLVKSDFSAKKMAKRFIATANPILE